MQALPDDNCIMRIETGSQNLSRTPGLFIYPAPRYKTNAVEAVQVVQGGAQLEKTPIKSGHSEEPTQMLYKPGGLVAGADSVGRRLDIMA